MAKFCSGCGKPLTDNANFCTSCGASITGKSPAKPQWQEKRERVLGKHDGTKDRKKPILIIIGAGLLGVWLYSNLPESGNAIIKVSPVVTNAVSYGSSAQQMLNIQATVKDGRIVIPLDVLKEKKFVKFHHGDGANGLPMLAYISGEGKIVTAVSMCEPCNSTDFHIKEDRVICNACGSTWELNSLTAVSGSCGRYPPDVVPNTVVDNEIQIDEQIVERWQRRI